MNEHMEMRGRAEQSAEPTHRRTVVTPPVDIYENAEEILVVADLPGVRREEISIELERQELSLSARRRPEEGAVRGEGIEYRRRFVLPRGIDAARISAELAQGVLRVRLPRAAALTPRRIEIAAS